MMFFKKKKLKKEKKIEPVRDEIPFDQLKEGVDYTVDKGLLIFTAHFLEKRGYCCENRCKNCPYGIHDPK